MAKIAGIYNPDAEAQQDFSAIPAGEYVARIIESDMKPTNKNDGEYLELVYEITEGEYKNRRLWVNLNLDNPNPKTVEIANRQMRSVREATGVLNPTDSQELHNKPHIVRVEFIPAGVPQKNGYTPTKDKNEIKAWKPLPAGASGNASAPNAGATSPTPTSPSSNNAAPWLRNKQQAA